MNENEIEPSSVVETVDPFDEMTDRELMVYIARSHRQILNDISEVKDQVMPMVEGLMSSPILRPFLKGM